VLLTPEKREPLRQLYRLLHIPEPDLVIYLRTDVHTLLARLRKRPIVFPSEADITYIMQMCEAYDAFFRRYKGNFVTIDTTALGYEEQITKLVLQEGTVKNE
jgi:deoxyadenosine/deoxycytidine kinase